MNDVYAYIEANRERYLSEVFDLIRQPSISVTGEGIEACAALLRRQMEAAGVAVQVFEGYGNPMLYGEVCAPGAGKTVLVYGHYDVQPPDPLEAWVSPPFEPTVRDGKIYARGAGDNKGQLFAQVKGAEAFLRTRGELPVNVKFLFEGEEETGSPHIGVFIRDHLELLACDLVYSSDGHQAYGERPEVLYGVRGMLYVELVAQGPVRDLHSGNYGGLADSPVERLCRLLPLLKDEDNRVAIPGFYDQVVPPAEQDLEALAALPLDEVGLARELGVARIAGDPGIPALQKRLLLPTLNVNGFRGGYTGEGSKTIIPSKAVMKIDMRLVEAQSPDDICQKFVAYLQDIGFGDVEVIRHGWMAPWRTPLDHPVAGPVIRAVASGFGRQPYRVPSLGGSLPLAEFKQIPDAGILLAPYAQHDENNHAPNESLSVAHFFKGARTMAALIEELGKESDECDGCTKDR